MKNEEGVTSHPQQVEPAWVVRLVEEHWCLRASIEGDLGEGSWEFAFYLMHGRTRSAIRWYTAEPTAEFPRPVGTGRFHVTGFVRRPGAKEGGMRHSAPIEVGSCGPGDADGQPAGSSAVKPFVLVKSYYGLGGDLCVLLSAWRFAEACGRKLVVDWSNGFYGEVDTGSLFHKLFDAPVFDSIGQYRGRQFSVFPSYWANRIDLPPVTYVSGVPLTLSRPEDVPSTCAAECIVLTRDSRRVLSAPREYFQFASQLKPAARILEVVNAQVSLLKRARYSIGVHYRHGNGERTVIPPDPNWFVDRIRARIREQGLHDDEVSVYVATDCGAALEFFRRNFPLTASLGKEYRPNGAGPLHNGRSDLASDEKPELAEGALADMYVLSRCDAFVGSLGYFSHFVQLLRSGAPAEIYDGPRVFTDAQRPGDWRAIATDAVLGPLVGGGDFPLDGLFVEQVDGVRRVHYYDLPVLDFDESDPAGAGQQIQALRLAVAARRLY